MSTTIPVVVMDRLKDSWGVKQFARWGLFDRRQSCELNRTRSHQCPWVLSVRHDNRSGQQECFAIKLSAVQSVRQFPGGDMRGIVAPFCSFQLQVGAGEILTQPLAQNGISLERAQGIEHIVWKLAILR